MTTRYKKKEIRPTDRIFRIKKYKLKLEVFELEQKLKVPHSQFTADFLHNPMNETEKQNSMNLFTNFEVLLSDEDESVLSISDLSIININIILFSY